MGNIYLHTQRMFAKESIACEDRQDALQLQARKLYEPSYILKRYLPWIFHGKNEGGGKAFSTLSFRDTCSLRLGVRDRPRAREEIARDFY